MTLRTDHIAGGAFILFALIVFALSRDLPWGSLAFPGAGMLPMLAAGAIIAFSLVLILRAPESPPLATLEWRDLLHAGPVALAAGLAARFYETLGFLVTIALMLFALTAGVERRNPLHAALYSVGVSLATYLVFTRLLKQPLVYGILGF